MMKRCEAEEIKEVEATELEFIEFSKSLASPVDVDEPRQSRRRGKRSLHTYGVDHWQWRQQEKRQVKFFNELYRKMKKNNCKYPGELIYDEFGLVYSPTYRELPRRLPHDTIGFGATVFWTETYARNKKAWHDAGLFKIHQEGGPYGLDILIHERCFSLTEEEVRRNLNSSKTAIKRLDEVAQSARGGERIQALARWLGSLKELGREYKPAPTMEETRSTVDADLSLSVSQDELPSPRRASKVPFYYLDGDGEPMNFREVFLRSHALENIVTSMCLEAPADEEVNLLLEIFGLCLAGGKELHIAIIGSIQDLAKAFLTYNVEFMSKREYLLQYVRDALSGLKLNAELERLEGEIVLLMQMIVERQAAGLNKEDGLSKTRELLQLDVRLRDLLQRKRLLMLVGDTQEFRTEKVELLKTLSTSLKQSALEAEKQIDENRDALSAHKERFFQALLVNLSYLQEELHSLLKELKLCSNSIMEMANESLQAAEPEPTANEIHVLQMKKTLEERFSETQGQIVSILRNVEVLKEEVHLFGDVTTENTSDAEKAVTETFDSIEELRKELEMVERPKHLVQK